MRLEAVWLALGASDLRGGIDVLLAQVLRGFAGGAQPHQSWLLHGTMRVPILRRF